MSDALDVVVDALAVARLSRLVREDKILDRPRHWFVVNTRCQRWARDFIKCPWCVGMDVALVVTLLRRFAPQWWDPLARALATSYVAAQAALHAEPKPTPAR